MTAIRRRQFLQMNTALYLLGNLDLWGAYQSPRIDETAKSVTISGRDFNWDWSQDSDRFRFLDQKGRVLTAGLLQPCVVVQPAGEKAARRCTPGKLLGHEVKGDRVVWTYDGVNGSAKLSVTWRFDRHGPWVEPVAYVTPAAEDIVSLYYFAEATGERARPSLETNGLVVPGICESPAVSPVASRGLNWDLTSWLGRGDTEASGLLQQWGLPTHYFCGFRTSPLPSDESSSAGNLSASFCCGLAELPNGDFFLSQQRGRAGLVLNLRGDLWGHLRGPGHFSLGGTILWAFAPNYYEAIRQYYRGLLNAGLIHKKANSPRKNAAALAPQWCTWGEQVARGKGGSRLDEPTLMEMYEELKASGMQAGMFSIDDKWEGRYGNLEHSAERFPHFEQFLDRARNEGYRIGLWAAFMRCENPAELGLTPSQMLRQTDRQPYITGEGLEKYYILDFTRAEVADVLRDRTRKFVRRYRPDLVKFDFGYEIPALNKAAPADMSWAGERFLWKGLDVVVNAMREENPDIVVMYYELSPLFTDYFDLHSSDDLFMAKGEFDLEANRRFFFSSLCGELGMPTYGSSGYDWDSTPSIWFDSVAIGTLGCLGSFYGTGEAGGKPTPERIAKYNGLTHLLRPSNTFSILPLDDVFEAPTRGAHASSWARVENGEVALIALRHLTLDGRKGVGAYRDIAEADASVVVASMTREGITRSEKLGVVPYGTGELKVKSRKVETGVAEVTTHYFRAAPQTTNVPIRNRLLQIPLRERSEKGAPVEWLEVNIRVP